MRTRLWGVALCALVAVHGWAQDIDGDGELSDKEKEIKVAQLNATVKNAADPLVEAILLGLRDKDYDLWIKNYESSIRSNLSRRDFGGEQSRFKKEYGYLGNIRFIGYLERFEHTTALYKANSTKLRKEVLVEVDFISRTQRNASTGKDEVVHNLIGYVIRAPREYKVENSL